MTVSLLIFIYVSNMAGIAFFLSVMSGTGNAIDRLPDWVKTIGFILAPLPMALIVIYLILGTLQVIAIPLVESIKKFIR